MQRIDNNGSLLQPYSLKTMSKSPERCQRGRGRCAWSRTTPRPAAATASRDPEARQAKKEQNWHFGFKANVGVGAVAGTVYTLKATGASARDLTRAASLVRSGDTDVWADSGYTGIPKWVEGGTPTASARWRVARRKGSVPKAERSQESILASACFRMEHAFHALKGLVGLRRIRYKGVSKVTN